VKVPRPLSDRRALSVAISRAAAASVADVLAAPASTAADARMIGVTGAPGAGKSTLIGRLVSSRVRGGKHIAVLAIDPSSPTSGGSVLGDRIRMEAISGDPRVYIRSLPSLGAHDGLSDNIAEVLATLDAYGFDEVLIETVGVGQTAFGIRSLVELEVLVLMPGAGDQIQAMKAGIIETADLIVVNKADLAGAERLETELLGVLQHGTKAPPVIRVSAGSNDGIDQLSDALDRLLNDLPRGPKTSSARQRFRVQSLIQRRVREILDAVPEEEWNRSIPNLYSHVVHNLAHELEEKRR